MPRNAGLFYLGDLGIIWGEEVKPMKTIRPLDIEKLYQDGFDAISLNRYWFSRLRQLIEATTWADDPDGIYRAVPDWTLVFQRSQYDHKIDQEAAHNALMLQHAPAPLSAACLDLLSDPAIMGDWLEAYQAKMSFISLWNGAEDLNWHWDGPAQADFFFLIYLNRNMGWPARGGGELLTGRRPLRSGYLRVVDDQVVHLETIAPASRTLVCCNNQNPMFVLKVKPLIEADERIVLMVGFHLIPTMCGKPHDAITDF